MLSRLIKIGLAIGGFLFLFFYFAKVNKRIGKMSNQNKVLNETVKELYNANQDSRKLNNIVDNSNLSDIINELSKHKRN